MLDFSILTPKLVYEFLLRWTHFLAGITWIGLLYWFNLVNVNFQKALEADIKPKVNPILIKPTLFYFRWGAVLTFLSGFLYYLNILSGETSSGLLKPLITWLVCVGVAYAIIFAITKPEGPMNNGSVLGVAVAIVVLVMLGAIYHLYKMEDVRNNSAYAIGMGGGMGTIMLLNVWGIIWPAQKRILGIVPLEEGADKVKLARRVFLASRTNTYLSIPMLFFMGASTHLPLVKWY